MDAGRLKAGDVLLYQGKGIVGWAIRLKTWAKKTSHVEVVGLVWRDQAFSIAARNEGCRWFPFEPKNLHMVLRPRLPFDADAANKWFQTEGLGQGYDWLGLYLSFIAVKQGRENRKMFCSELTTRYLRAGGLEPFTSRVDADAVAPVEFEKSGVFDLLWVDSDES